jgi:hypothetical protein
VLPANCPPSKDPDHADQLLSKLRANFGFQLRWTTGTVWYDDAELLDLGPVVHVETY